MLVKNYTFVVVIKLLKNENKKIIIAFGGILHVRT